VLSYRVTLDVSVPTRLGAGPGISQATAYRYKDEAVEVAPREGARPWDRKAHEPAGNVQALATPRGNPLRVSDVLPGSTDSGYEGGGAGVRVP
jgi:hypothetical protein